MARYALRSGDLEPPLDATLFNAAGTPIDLTAATSVKFRMRQQDAAAWTVDRLITIVSATAGTVRVVWATGETNAVAFYEFYFEINWATGRRQSVPAEGYLTFPIEPRP